MKQIILNEVWEMKDSQQDNWLPAVVPGSVYEDLLREGKIEDPFYRDNEVGAREVSEKDYEYRRTFQIDGEFLTQDKIVLVCEGIDTIAEVFINEIKVMDCKDMHMVLEADIKAALTLGNNVIRFAFTSPYKQIEIIKAKHPYMDLDRHLFQGKMQMRKAHYMFGWDWGPALADMGIWRPVWIRGYNDARIKDVNITQEHSFGKVKLDCKVETEVYTGKVETRVSIYAPDGELLHTETTKECQVTYTVIDPELWWCINYGNQPLYTIKTETIHQGRVTDELIKKIGLRKINVCQDKDEWGEKFHFIINDVEVFAKGADYIPEDSLLGRMTTERSKKIIDSCIKANFNMIRVWGGGVYPTEEFFNYCDETGIMIWQDFMFANIVCIWEGEEKETMTEEVIQLTKRLRNHPCIALLCGNNETELMVWDSMEVKYKEMYVQQFEVDMKAIVNREAPEIFYWPSSPSSWGSMKEVENMNVGDTHDWNVWHGQKPFTYFRSTYPRFNSEFGLQSFPCMKTIEAFTEKDDRNIFSYVMEGHQKSKNGNEVINYYVSQYFKFPKDFRSFIYLSQTIQLEGIRYGVEHWRRNRNKQRCMGSLFWQVNDCWPVASWASIDYFGRWKALQYGAKRFFEPILVSACESGTEVDLHISNETLTAVAGNLEWKIYHVEKGLIQKESLECRIERLTTECCKHLDLSELLLTEADYRKYYIAYSFEANKKVIGSGTVIFKPAKHFDFRKPTITCEKVDNKTLKISSNTFAKFVELQYDKDIIFSDNYFDLIPDTPKLVTMEEETDGLPVIHSLYDSYGE